MEITQEERAGFEEAVVNMTVASSDYFKDYVYYMHLLSKCRVVMDKNLPAAAGVSFHKDHYRLHLNPTEVIFSGTDKEGKKVEVLGFNIEMPLAHRIGILKHEMSHISNGHLIRVEDRNFRNYNLASDCALNQEIERTHLPDYAIYPDNFPVKVKVPWGATAEQYYDLIEEESPEDNEGECGNGNGNGQGGTGKESDGSGNGKNPGSGPRCVDDHEVWKQSEGDTALQKEITKQMVEQAGNQTTRSRGNLPSNYAQMIDNLTVSREVDWRQLLRRIVGNKKANIRKTIIRRDRRMPGAFWIKGRVKDRIFNLGVVSDVSGSMSDKALKEVWGEILNICKLYKIPVQMVQIDTEAYAPEPFTLNTKKLERKATGGTILHPALDMFKKHRVDFQALVVCTDGGVSDDDVEHYYRLNKPVIWLIEPTGYICPSMNRGKMKAIQLKPTK